MKKITKKTLKMKARDIQTSEVPVLYQNLNGELYAFTELSGQIFWGKLSQETGCFEEIQSFSSAEEIEPSKTL